MSITSVFHLQITFPIDTRAALYLNFQANCTKINSYLLIVTDWSSVNVFLFHLCWSTYIFIVIFFHIFPPSQFKFNQTFFPEFPLWLRVHLIKRSRICSSLFDARHLEVAVAVNADRNKMLDNIIGNYKTGAIENLKIIPNPQQI